jgi:hypothetical protein
LLHLQSLRRCRRWRWLPSSLGQEKGSVSLAEDLGSQRGRGERPAASRVTATFSLLPRPRQILQRACRGLARGVRASAVAGDLIERRGKGVGGEWRPGEGLGRSRGFYTPVVDSVLRDFDRHGLGNGAARSGWRCGLCAVM